MQNELTIRIFSHLLCFWIDDDNIIKCNLRRFFSNVVKYNFFFLNVVECDFLFRVTTKSRFAFRSRFFRRLRCNNEFESHIEWKTIANNHSTLHNFKTIIHNEKSSSEEKNETNWIEKNVNILWMMTNMTSMLNVIMINITIMFFLKILIKVLKCTWNS
jgi:hypothetical protein